MIFYSIFKSFRLSSLQRKLAANKSSSEMLENLVNPKAASKEARLWEKYLSLCQNDPGIGRYMAEAKLTAKDLKDIYWMLMKFSGRWVRGHFVPLSSIAYGEPLIYIVESRKLGKEEKEIASMITRYWNDEFPPGFLLSKIDFKAS